ncbi:MAG: aldo/keto reductase, partial [Crocosphaera sp.]
MRYRRFGKTNLDLSIFSLGTMRCLTSATIFNDTLQTALSLGINHLETARGYGKSEHFLGNFLQQQTLIPRQKLYITTKLSPTPDADTMSQWIDESLERLQLDYIDCVAIHGINTWEHLEWVTGSNGCFLALKRALEGGKIHHIGFSTHGSLDVILAAIETDLFEFINLHYYYFFQRNAPAISLASQKDLGIFIIS